MEEARKLDLRPLLVVAGIVAVAVSPVGFGRLRGRRVVVEPARIDRSVRCEHPVAAQRAVDAARRLSARPWRRRRPRRRRLGLDRIRQPERVAGEDAGPGDPPRACGAAT